MFVLLFLLEVALAMLETAIEVNINDSTSHQLPYLAIAKFDMLFARCLSSLVDKFPNKRDKSKTKLHLSPF